MIEVLPEWDLLYDVDDSITHANGTVEKLIYKMITVNGILRFDDTKDRHLRA